ncbi:hypothetical protein H4R33_002758 [Dimargaris cristalligena]|nr:hypothetical protein H4R33_002758 [Dimargaris cristalligena]
MDNLTIRIFTALDPQVDATTSNVISKLQVLDKCVGFTDSSSVTDPDTALSLFDCSPKESSNFNWIRVGPSVYLIHSVGATMCLARVGENELDNRLGFSPCNIDDPNQGWKLFEIGGRKCDSEVNERFEKGQITIVDLMHQIDLNYTAYIAPIKSQGIPTFSKIDHDLLSFCDGSIQTFFDTFERVNQNMFTKLSSYYPTYAGQTTVATNQAVNLFINGKLSTKLWKAVRPGRDMFIRQFTTILKVSFPETAWLVTVAETMVFNELGAQDSEAPPELSSWGEEVRNMFKQSVQDIWELHIKALASRKQDYEVYAQLYQTKNLIDIFGAESRLSAYLVVELAKRITKDESMRKSCCVTMKKIALGHSDYMDLVTRQSYRVIMPGNSFITLTSAPMNEFAKVSDMVESLNGWDLPKVKTLSALGTCRFRV